MKSRVFKEAGVFLAVIAMVITACAPAAAPAPAPAPGAPAQPKQPVAAVAPQPASAAPSAPAPASAPAAPTKITPKRGGTVTLTTNIAGAVLDPYLNSTQGLQALGCCYLQLLRVKDEGVGQNYNVTTKPYLAESWDIAPDGKSVTFRLRKGAKWAPVPPLNGREVTAADVKYSYDRLAFDSKSLVRGAFVNLAGVEVLDKYTVKLVATQPSALLIENARQHPAWIIPREVVEKEGNIASTMIGAGPFYLEKTIKGVGFTLARNDNFYDAPKPYPDKIKWVQIIDRAAQMAAFRAGELDLLPSMNKANREAILKTNPKSRVEFEIPKGAHWFIFKANQPQAPWADKRVRVAMSKALDRDTMLAALEGGEGEWGGVIAGSYSPAHALTTEEKRKVYNLQYDLKEAKRLMKEAGYPSGFKVTLNYADKNFTVSPHIIMGANMLKENLGVDIDLSKGLEYTEWLATGFTGTGSQGVGYLTHGGGRFLWWQYWQFQYHSKGKWHSSQINSADLDKRIEDIFTTFDEKEQARKSRELQYYILSDLLYWIPLPRAPTASLIQPWLQDYNELASISSDYVDFWVSK